MSDETPQPLPGIRLTPRLLAYEIARQCEKEEVHGIIVLMIDSNDAWHIQASDGTKATDLAFASIILQREAFETSIDFDPEEEADPGDQA